MLTGIMVLFLVVGQEVEIEIPALSQVYRGPLTALVPAADPHSRTFRAKVQLPNPEYHLASGLYARIMLRTMRQNLLEVLL